MKPHLHPALLSVVMVSMVAPATAVDITLTNGSSQPVILTTGSNTVTVTGTDSATISLLTGLSLAGSQFTKDGTGTLTISDFATLTLVDLMTVKSGKLVLNPTILANLLSFNSAYDIQGTSSLVMGTNGAYGTLKLSGTGTLQFTKGGTASIQARSGNTVTNAILFDNSSNTCALTFSESTSLVSGTITSLNNLTINANATMTFGAAVTVTNALTINKADNGLIRTFNALVTAGSLTLQAGESGNIASTAFTGGTSISGTVNAGAYTNITGSVTAQKFLATGGNATIGANLSISQNIDIDNAGNTMTGTVGAGSVNIYDGGTLTLSGTLNLAASGAITIGSQGSSGTATLNVTGSGIINANTGTITVGRSGVAGSLTIQNTAVVNAQTLALVNGSVTLSGTGRLNIGSGGITGTGTINLGAGTTLRAIDNWTSSATSTIAFGANAANISSSTFNITLTGALTGTGSLTKTGSGTLTINGADKAFTGTSITVSTGTLAMNVSTANILSMAQSYSIAAGATLQLNTGTYASALKITGTGNLVFGNGATTVTLRESTGAATLGHNITFGNVASTLTLDPTLTTLQGTLSAGSDLTLNGTQFTTANGAVNITGKLTLGLAGDAAHATRTFNALVTAGSLTLQAGTSTIASAINFAQDATITGALTAQGYANLSTGTGKQIAAGSYLSTGGNNTVTGRLNLSGDAVISGLNDVWTGTVNSANLSINSGASLSMNSATYTLGAGGAINIGNTGTSGTGTLNITGSSTVNGSTGTIKIGNATGTSGLLNIGNTSVVNTAGIVINNGSITLSDTATLNLGSTGISGTGTINFNGGTTIGSSADWSSASGVTYAVNGSTASTFNTNGHNATLNGNITGSGILTKTGSGTLTIGGSSKTFSGTLNINLGTVYLNLSAGSNLAGTVNIASSTTLQVNGSTYSGTLGITGSGALVFDNSAASITLKEGTGATALSHNITFGNVASTLTLDPTLTTLQGTLSAGSDLTLNGSQFTTANGAVNITGKLTLGLAGDAAHATRTFNALVTAGSLTLQAGTSTIASAVNFAQDATITGALTAQGYANLSTGTGKQIAAGSYLSIGGHNTVAGRLNLSGDAVISGLNDVWTGTVNSANLSINSGASLSMNSATYTLGAGGAINIGNTGTSGTGTLNITGSSTVNGSTGTINIGNGSGTAGSLNIQNTSVVNTAGISINNGSITLSDTASLNIGSSGVSGTGTVNFNGGTTIKADADWTSASGVGYAVNGSTSSTLNTNGHNVTLNGNISGSGRLYKTGQGTLTISGGDKSFTGTTTAAQGTVHVNANMYGTGNSYVAAGGTISISNTGSICTGGSSQATSTVQVTAKAAGTNATLSNANVTASGIVSVDTTGTVKAALNNAKVTINRTGATIDHAILNNTTVSLAQNASVTLNDVVLGTGSQITAAAGATATLNLQNTKLQIVNANITGTLSSKTVAPVVSANIFNSHSIKVSGQLTVDLSNCHYNPGNHYGVLAVELGALAADSDVNIQLTGCDPKWKIITDPERLKGVKLGTEAGVDLTGTELNEHGIDLDGRIYIQVPEPSSTALSLLALSALAMRRRRK
ncbi:PEP-CTERM sorting domain-containing protein [Akkermansia glycaniphila]|nr:PEP-CTERM sorting domain-containing protein [Akkermansia glycaniphila]